MTLRVHGSAVRAGGDHDPSPQMPVVQHPDAAEEHGRGVLLVDRLADCGESNPTPTARTGRRCGSSSMSRRRTPRSTIVCSAERVARRLDFPGSTCARSSTDRASDYGSEGWGFESLRARWRKCWSQRPIATIWSRGDVNDPRADHHMPFPSRGSGTRVPGASARSNALQRSPSVCGTRPRRSSALATCLTTYDATLRAGSLSSSPRS